MTIRVPALSRAEDDLRSGSVTPERPGERTPWLLAFLCILIPVLPSFVVLAGPLKGNGSPARMISILFLGLIILGFTVNRRTATTRRLLPGIFFILLYFLLELAIYGVGLTHVDHPAIEANKTRVMIMMLAYAGVALYTMTRVETMRQRTVVLGSLAIGLTYACVVGLLQMINIDLRFLFQPPGFVINTEDLEMATRWGVKRVTGTSTHAIEYSVLAAATVPLTIHFARYGQNRQVRMLAVLACGLALLAIPAAVSRTGVISLAAALLVYMWNFKVREIAVTTIGAAAGVACYIMASPGTANALWETIIHAEDDASILTRVDDYATVSQTFRSNPIFGLGLGASLPSEYGFLDNEWLQAIVQGGIVGIAAMIVVTVGGILGIAAALRRATTPRERDQAYVLGSIFVAILVSSFTFDLFSFHQAARILFVVFGLLWCNFVVPLPGQGAVFVGPVR